jgi:hypothetical protein
VIEIMKAGKSGLKLLLIAATAAGAVVLFVMWLWQKQEAVDTRYKDTLTQLVRPRHDSEGDFVSPASSLKDLNDLIVRKSHGDPAIQQKLKDDVSQRFVELFKSHAFDLNQGSNVELETTVEANWKEYSEHLSRDPNDNVWIIYRYFLALQSLGKKEPALIHSALLDGDGSLSHNGQTNDKNAAALLQKLNSGYRRHVEILRSAPGDVNKKYLLTSFCWYRDAINNSLLAGYVFRYDEVQVSAEELRCKEAGQSIRAFSQN